MIGKKLKVTKPSDWYSISLADIITHGGGGLMLKYHNSPMEALKYEKETWFFF